MRFRTKVLVSLGTKGASAILSAVDRSNGKFATCWGTDVHTMDSDPAAAAVHAGVAKVSDGQSNTVFIRAVEVPSVYEGSTRNGVRSYAHTDDFAFDASYEFLSIHEVFSILMEDAKVAAGLLEVLAGPLA
jgi:hypothetical protein